MKKGIFNSTVEQQESKVLQELVSGPISEMFVR
jgi:hypothetical protein